MTAESLRALPLKRGSQVADEVEGWVLKKIGDDECCHDTSRRVDCGEDAFGGCKVVAGKVERYSKNNGKSNNKCCRAAVPIPMACEADQRKVGLKGQGRNSDVELAPCAIR